MPPMTMKRRGTRSRGMRQIAVVGCLVAALPTVVFGFRAYHSFLFLRSAYAAGAPTTSSVRPWMTLRYIAAVYRTSDAALIERLGLPAGTESGVSLKSLAEREGISPLDYTQRVQRAIAKVAPDGGSDQPGEKSGRLGAIGDAALTALLTYGYAVLGLTLLLGAIGLPLPDGIATIVAGSLAAQGRMQWAWAATIVVIASVLGDVVGYGVGRILGEGVLERYGRWFGYTAMRRSRVEMLFDQWGSLMVLLTRTLVSYLSSVASLLAGLSHYRLTEFLVFAVIGRVMWTSAYLGLGYAIGGDLEAAAGFLKNVSGMLISSALLVGAGVVAFGPSFRSARDLA
jgi:membrane protein DedA with SNARE-associated domain